MIQKIPHFARFHARANIEGWGLAAAAVVGAGAAAYSASKSSSAQKDALEYQANNYPKAVPYTPVTAEFNPGGAVNSYLDTVKNYGAQAQNAANTVNTYYQQSIQALAPGTKQGIYLASKDANQLLRGNLPADVSSSIARNAAQAGLTGGFGGSQMAGNLTARDLGRTSLDLQQQGLQNLTGVTRLAQSLTPASAGDILGNPSNYFSAYNSYAQHNADVMNQAAMNNANVQNQNNQGAFQAGLAGVQASNINPTANALASGAGSLSQIATQYYGGGLGGAAAYGAGSYGQNTLGQNYQGTIDWSKVNYGRPS